MLQLALMKVFQFRTFHLTFLSMSARTCLLWMLHTDWPTFNICIPLTSQRSPIWYRVSQNYERGNFQILARGGHYDVYWKISFGVKLQNTIGIKYSLVLGRQSNHSFSICVLSMYQLCWISHAYSDTLTWSCPKTKLLLDNHTLSYLQLGNFGHTVLQRLSILQCFYSFSDIDFPSQNHRSTKSYNRW